MTSALTAAPAPPYANASLYVGDLQPDVTEALLFEIFNAVGPVGSVRVCRDAATRRSLGYAYVNFHKVDDAERALDTMNFKNIRSRPCRIMWSHRDPSLRKSGLGNIFVNHLDKSIDNKQLYDTFSMFGNILSCKVAMNKDKRESLGYGFVHYESAESAEQAINRVDGKMINGAKVSVQAFKSRKDRTGGANKFKFTNIFVKNLPPEITKEQLETLFKPYGTITSTVINVDKETKSRAFGFINFAAPEEATAAVDAMNNYELDGKKLYVSRAQKRDEREKELREKFESLKAERAKKYAGVNLYVKNLSDDMDDGKVTAEFSKYGQITSAKIMRDAAGKSRGFGFVCFSTPEEATKAVTELNGRMLDGKPLYVALAQRKDVRRQQLEAQYAARAKMTGGGMGGIGGMGGMGLGAQHNAGFPNSAAMQAAAAGLYGQPNPMMQFPPNIPPHRQFLYGQQGMVGVGGMPNMGGVVLGAQGFPRFPQQPQLLQPGQNGVGGAGGGPNNPQQRGAGQQPGPNAGGLNAPQGPMNYPLMPLGVNPQQQRGLPLQTPAGVGAGPTQVQPGLLPQQQTQRGGPQQGAPGVGPGAALQQQQQRGQGPQRGAGPGPAGQQPPSALTPQQQQQQQQQRNGQQANGLPGQPGVNKNLPPHILQQQAAVAAQQQQQQQNIRYADNVRNRGVVNPNQSLAGNNPNLLPNGVPAGVVDNTGVLTMPLPSEPLTIKALASAPEEMRKQMIGERLFPLIKQQEPNLAGKITGMLLEMDNGELIHLLESLPALNEKIQEALQVLQQHPEMVELQQDGQAEADK